MSLQYQQDLKQQLANRRKHTLKMDLFKSNNSKPVLNKLSNIFNDPHSTDECYWIAKRYQKKDIKMYWKESLRVDKCYSQ